MIKSTKCTIKFANKGKRDSINLIIDEYRNLVSFFVDLLWDLDKVPVLVPKEITSKAITWLSARMVQCASKQASGIVRGTKMKQARRLAMIKKLMKEGKKEQAKKLQKVYDTVSITKPDISSIEMELSSQIVYEINLENSTSFDGWVTLTSIGNKMKLKLPFKKTKHFNKLLKQGGVLTSGARFSKKAITFMFNIPDTPVKKEGKVIGIDIGQKTCLSVSNGQQIETDPHGYTYMSICKELARKKRGSKGFLRKQKHRTNFINYCVNKVNFEGVKELRIEKIRQLRNGKRTSRLLSGWSYKEIFDSLKAKARSLGVHVTELSPTYTSQRCSKCGWVRKSNRKGKVFKCGNCGYTADADLNASFNISLELPAISKEVRLKELNRKGFFWNPSGITFDCHEPIVRDARKLNF